MDIEYTDTPPPGYTYQQWINECCCACYGCEECEHDCDRSEEERAKCIAAMDPENWGPPLSREEFEKIRGPIKKLVIPTILNHIEYPDLGDKLLDESDEGESHPDQQL